MTEEEKPRRTQNSHQKSLLTENRHTVPETGCFQSLFLCMVDFNSSTHFDLDFDDEFHTCNSLYSCFVFLEKYRFWEARIVFKLLYRLSTDFNDFLEVCKHFLAIACWFGWDWIENIDFLRWLLIWDLGIEIDRNWLG